MFTFCLERPTDHPHIETLLDIAFGADRKHKASYRLRDNQPSIAHLNHVVLDSDGLVRGTVRFWDVAIRDMISGIQHSAILLGPVAVCPSLRSQGLGGKLMTTAVKAAEDQGYRRILLVGDAGYYSQYGFKPVLPNFITLPGGKDARRLMVRQSASLPSLPAVGRIEVPNTDYGETSIPIPEGAAALAQVASV